MTRRAVGWLCLIITAAIIIFDVLMWLDAVPRNTVSELFVDTSAEHPAMLVMLGFLCGHLGAPLRRRAKVVYLTQRSGKA